VLEPQQLIANENMP